MVMMISFSLDNKEFLLLFIENRWMKNTLGSCEKVILFCFVLFYFGLLNVYRQSSTFFSDLRKFFLSSTTFFLQLHACSTCNQITFDFCKTIHKTRMMIVVFRFSISPPLLRRLVNIDRKITTCLLFDFSPSGFLFCFGSFEIRVVHRKLAWLKMALSLRLELIGIDRLIWIVNWFFSETTNYKTFLYFQYVLVKN